MTIEEKKEIQEEIENIKKMQEENIVSGYFDIAQELEHDITYLKNKLGDTSSEYSHLM